jgi:hypothetical protein
MIATKLATNGPLPPTSSTIDTKRRTTVLIAAVVLAAVAFLVPAASPAHAAGFVNCVPLSQMYRSGACWESVWVNGVQHRMVFAQEAKEFPGTIPTDRVGNFYVIGPQTDTPQGALPFTHDHTVADTNFTKVHGFLVFCSEAGITSGSCETAKNDTLLPLAGTVNGQNLKSAETIESAASSGLVTLVDTRATFAAKVTGDGSTP